MKVHSIFLKAALPLAGTLFFAAASAQDRPAKRNNNFNPAAANSFSYATTGFVVKIKSAGIAGMEPSPSVLPSRIQRAPDWM